MKKYKSIITLILTVLSISFLSCTEEVVEPKENLFEQQNDFFPLTMGNYWKYDFIYAPDGYWGDRLNGQLTWEVLNCETIDTIKNISILETIIGVRIFTHFGTGQSDTSQINIQQQIQFFENNSGFVTIKKPNFLNRSLMFHKYFVLKDEQVLIRNDNNRQTNDLFSLDGEWDIIFLYKDIGIKEWSIVASHNSGPGGKLNLIDYKVIK